MTLDELVEITRRSLRDTDSQSYGWLDEELEEYLNEAQEIMARRTLCLIESIDAAICVIPLVANSHSYLRHSKIVQIDEVRPSWSTDPLTDALTYKKFSTGWAAQKGLPDAFCCDYSSGYLTLNRNPATVTTESLSLTVRRLPKLMTSAMSGVSAQGPEVPEAYQRALRHFACYRALEAKDSETADDNQADSALLKWERAISDITSQVAQLQPRIYQAQSQF